MSRRPLIRALVLSVLAWPSWGCRAEGSQAPEQPGGSVDNASRAGLVSGPVGGSASVQQEREDLLASFRKEAGATASTGDPPVEETASPKSEEVELVPIARAVIPQECGFEDSSAPYGPVKRGTRVILGRHREWRGNENWATDMAAYVGREATVRELAGTDGAGCSIVRVDIDQGSWVWRVRDMRLPGGSGVPTKAAAQKMEAVAKARSERVSKLMTGPGATAGLAVEIRRAGKKAKGKERIFVADGALSYDPEQGLHTLLLREREGKGWILLGVHALKPGYYRGDAHAANAVLAVHEGKAWSPDSPNASWSVNPGGYVNLQIDEAEGGQLRIRFGARLVANRGEGRLELDGGYAVVQAPK